MTKNVLVIGPSTNTRGGISTVINIYKSSAFWDKWSCIHIETYLDSNFFLKIYYFFNGIFNFLRFVTFSHLVHIHFSEPISAFRKLFFVLLSKLFGIKIVVHFHGFTPLECHSFHIKLLYKIIFIFSDRIIVLSEYWKNSVCHLIESDNKVFVIYNPISNYSLKKFKFRNTYKENIIMFSGSIIKRKGYIDLINAFAIVSKIYPEWVLVFAGSGDLNHAKKIVSNLNLDTKIFFVGWITGENKRDLFLKSKIFCLPTYAEGFPMAIIEAIEYRIPVITSNLPCFHGLLIDNENVLLFKSGDYFELADKIAFLIKNYHLSDKLVANAEHFVKKSFSLSIMFSQLDKIYNSIIHFDVD